MVSSESNNSHSDGAEHQISQSSSMEKINASMIKHACKIAEEIGVNTVLVYVDLIKSRENLKSLLQECHCILAAREEHVLDELKTLDVNNNRIIQVPYMKLSRHSQVKVAAMLALSQGLIHRTDRIVCLSGLPKYGILDNLTVLDLEREFEMFSSDSLDIANQMLKPEVFDRLLTLVLELAEEGKEGRPVGTIFILGDHEKVMSMSHQMVITGSHIGQTNLPWERLYLRQPAYPSSLNGWGCAT